MVKKMISYGVNGGQPVEQNVPNEYVPNGQPEYQLANQFPQQYHPYGVVGQTQVAPVASASDVANCNMPPRMLIPDNMANQHWYHQQQPQQPTYNYVATSNTREMRNKAEKQRRDRLNAFITELAKLIPLVARSQKRLDKTSILRLAATHLRIYQTLVKQNAMPQMDLPPQVDQFVLDQLICDEMGGFLLILSPMGKIIFVSHTVETLLGHLQTDLMGQSLFTVTALEDHEKLRMYLSGEGEMQQGWKKYYTVKLKRAGPKSETAQYESVRMIGVHKNLLAGKANVNNNEDDGQVSCSSSTSALQAPINSEILIFLVKICRPQPLVDRLVTATRDEYRTRHLIDSRIVGCDQRISLIAGYMIDEVQGHSAFQYMHKEDVRFVMIALRQMYDKGESRGHCCYRLKSSNGHFIYLKTFGFLEIDEKGIVESFQCVNILVDEQEGKALINEMKGRYSALFTSSLANLPHIEDAGPAWKSPATALPAIAAPKVDRTEDPQTLELAINELMQNLPSPEKSVDESELAINELMQNMPSPETKKSVDESPVSSQQRYPATKIPKLSVPKTPEYEPVTKPHLRVTKSNGKRASTASLDHVKRQRLTSVDSQSSQLSSPGTPFCNAPLSDSAPLKMPKLEEDYLTTPSDLLRHHQNQNSHAT